MPSRLSGAKVRARMDSLGMTAAQVCAKSTLSPSTMNRIINDKDVRTSDATLQLLADSLSCNPFDLLKDDAVSDMIREETEHAVSGVVAEAVAEALTVVVDELAPDETPEQIADAVPPIQAAVPPVLDVAAYVDYIRSTCDKAVQIARDRLNDMRKSRNFWRAFCFVLMVCIVALSYYFVWEILNPDKGLTAILWNIYNTKPIPGVTPQP